MGRLRRQRLEHSHPDARLGPAVEAVVGGRVRAIALGQVAPRRSGPQHVEDRIEDAPVIRARHAAGLVGQERLYDPPLRIAQVEPRHSQPPSSWKLNQASASTGTQFMSTGPSSNSGGIIEVSLLM